MLTADLVLARRRGDELLVPPLDAARRALALTLAHTYSELARGCVGQPRRELDEALRGVAVPPRDRKLALGMAKMVTDLCSFEEDGGVDPIALRREVFRAAAAARRAQQEVPGTSPTAGFDRAAVLAPIAAAHALEGAALERALYADLPGEHRVTDAVLPAPDVLVARYELALHQAVLLRATQVRATVRTRAPEDLRALFRKLKFLQLLVQIQRDDAGSGYRLVIDGPFSLFESVTRYGLALALALPSLRACDELTLEADVLWGKLRSPLRFRLRQRQAAPDDTATGGGEGLSDTAAALLAGLRDPEVAGPWRAEVATTILDVPGLGVTVPDLRLEHALSGAQVYVEVLGFWNREAVWKRVELARAGLAAPIVFVVSRRLRVSEAVLPDDLPAALYVFGTTPSPRALRKRVEAVAQTARQE